MIALLSGLLSPAAAAAAAVDDERTATAAVVEAHSLTASLLVNGSREDA